MKKITSLNLKYFFVACVLAAAGLISPQLLDAAGAFLANSGIISKGPVSIGTSSAPNSKAVLDLVSTTKGALLPRMTATQRDAISAPPTGLLVYNTTSSKVNQYDGANWLQIFDFTTASAGFNTLSPMTTGGDLIYGGASGAGTRLANGSAGQFLKSQGTTLAPVWDNPTIALTAPTVQKFASGSGTYTTPSNVLYLRVRAIGGGGGGAGGGSGGGAGGNGGDTTFSASSISAGGGVGGTYSGGGDPGGTGGVASVTGTGITINGGAGQGGNNSTTTGQGAPLGGSGAFGGAGGGAVNGGAGYAAATNSGGGGQGGTGNAANIQFGSGGGSGAYVEKIITSPASSYSYAVGAAGAAGTAGTSGNAGTAGGSGMIFVEEFYQ